MNSVTQADGGKTAVRVSRVSIAGNIFLFLFKLTVGLVSRSAALLSDAVHSAADVFSVFIVLWGIRLAAKAPDAEHPYGHERFECLAAMLLSFILGVTGLFIGKSAAQGLMSAPAEAPMLPSAAALLAAGVSVLLKEGLFRYTRRYARRLGSAALMAHARHHRSDAMATAAVFIGVGGSRLGLVRTESAASLLVCCFIFKAAVDIFRDAAEKLVDRSCPETLCRELLACAQGVAGVLGAACPRSREFGNRVCAELEISADALLTLAEADALADTVRRRIEAAFPVVKHLTVIVFPTKKNF